MGVVNDRELEKLSWGIVGNIYMADNHCLLENLCQALL